MTMPLTFDHAGSHRAPTWWPLALMAAALIAASFPASACEKAVPTLVASVAATPSTAVFTGELVNGVPVYRLPAMTVFARRPAELAKTQRDAEAARKGRPRPSAAAAPTLPARSVANAARPGAETRPCIG